MRVLLIVALLLPPITWAAGTSKADFICRGVSNESERSDCIERAAMFTEERDPDSTIKQTHFLLGWLWPAGWWLLYYGFALVIGAYVYRDAKRREWLFLGIRPPWWTVLVLFDPALGVIAYWAAHYSKLAQTYSEATAKAPT